MTKYLFCTIYCAKWFTYIIPVNLHNHSVMIIPVTPPCNNQGSVSFSNHLAVKGQSSVVRPILSACFTALLYNCFSAFLELSGPGLAHDGSWVPGVLWTPQMQKKTWGSS